MRKRTWPYWRVRSLCFGMLICAAILCGEGLRLAAQTGCVPDPAEAGKRAAGLVIEALRLHQAGDPGGALAKLHAAHRFAEEHFKSNRSIIFWDVNIKIASIYNELGQPAVALDYAKRSMANLEGLQFPVFGYEACETRHLMAMSLVKLGQHPRALSLHEQNLKHYSKRPVDLGPAEDIEDELANWQEHVASAGDDLAANTAEALAKSKECLGSLAKLLAPALEEMKGRKRWLIGPDGPLWLLT